MKILRGILNGRKPKITVSEATIATVAFLLLGGVFLTNTIITTTTETMDEFNSDIDFRSRNFHKLMRRDVLLSSSMAYPSDSQQAIEVSGDTLIIRFSELDSVRYFLSGTNVYREDVPIIDNVVSFDITYDTITVDVSIVVAAKSVHPWVNNGELYSRQYEWVTVLNNRE